MQDVAQTTDAGRKFSIHYYLRPDHRDVADLWLASGRAQQNTESERSREWLFLQMENLHRSGGYTACAFNRQTGGMAGYVTINPGAGTLDQIIVAQSARGSGVATLLLNEAKRKANGSLDASVSDDNLRATRFLEREGFRKAGTAASTEGQARLWTMRWHTQSE